MDDTMRESKKSMPMMVMGIVAFGAVIAVFGYLMTRNQNSQKAQDAITTTPTEMESTTGAKRATDEAAMTTKETIEVVATPFVFSVKEIKVKKGDTVNIAFVNKAGNHDFVIDELGVKTKILKTGESENVTLVANKVGTYEYYCSVGNHRAMGMVGKLIVE